MTKVREFNEGGEVRAPLGDSYLRGPATFVSYAKRTSGNEYLISYGPSATAFLAMGIEAGTLTVYKGGDSHGPAVSGTPWSIFVATKASGSVKPKFYIYNFTTEEWVADEISGEKLMTDGPEEPPEHLVFGQWGGGGSEQFNGKMAAAAMFKRALSKSEVHELITLGSVSEWMKLTPNGLWRFDEALPADLTGNGANASLVTGTELLEEEIPFPYGELEGGGEEGGTVKVKAGGSLVTAKRWVKQGGILVRA